MATNDDDNFNPLRRLCPDGSCIGVIGSDGRCSVCGTPDDGAAAGPARPPGDDGDWDAGTDETPDTDGPAASDEEGSSAFDSNRRLCPDDACIGVIGKDNRCSVCGRPAAG